MVKTVPATAAHITAIYGEPLRQTVHGFAGIEGDAVRLLGAIYAENGRVILTFKADDVARENMREHAKTILKGARRLLAIAEQWRLPVQTVVDEQYPRARELVEHLGFRRLEKDIYQWQT